MTYDELVDIESKAWTEYLNVLAASGIDRSDVSNALDAKDCFNDVFDAVISCVDIEDEE